MEEPDVTIELPSRDLSAEIKAFENDCSCSSHRDGVSMPICFLVKEQAKSFIAIQEIQKRLNHVETVQEDVIDAIIEFRNYLSDSRNQSNASPLNTTRRLVTTSPKIGSGSKLSQYNVPSPSEASHSILKNRCYSSRDCDNLFNGIGRTASVHEQSPKHFDLNKIKDSALESDKQDSGLDSDCREHHEIQASLNKNAVNLENDELLELLDEISHRSEILQQQLVVVGEATTTLVDLKDAPVADTSQAAKSGSNSTLESKLDILDNSNGSLQIRDNSPKSTPRNHRICAEARVPSVVKENSGLDGLFENKPLFGKVSPRRRPGHSIDSTMVSSILKETNVVELQRQALIHLVDNAVLSTKLRESEQSTSFKQLESDKVENALKEESRLLMMENRELRIGLEEHKLETNALKSRLVMLERVLQSVSSENDELNWQLGESLNLQNLPRKRLSNYSSSLRFENLGNVSKSGRRSSLPSQSASADDGNVHCLKSKLLSNNSSYLNVTLEDEDIVPTSRSAFKRRNGPLHASTPMIYQTQKELGRDSPSDASPVNFLAVKKCLNSNYGTDPEGAFAKTTKSRRCLEGTYTNIPETNVKEFSRGTQGANAVKYPFNTILEKLKHNSEYRLSRSGALTKSGEMCAGNSNASPKSFISKINSASGLHESHGNHSQNSDIKASQGSNADIALERKNGRNIQQRIQNILDRIVAESEEAS